METYNSVVIDKIDYAGKLEKDVNMFQCECGFDEIEREFYYCPNCGKKIDWQF